jgi:1,3-beta-glucanosyltransferase GAS5
MLDSSEMTSVFSGGLVYEWSQETSDYGLVDLSSGNITILPDYNNLKAEFQATAMPSGDGGYNANGVASTCPSNSTDFTSWAVLPAMPAAAQVYINNGAGQALGYKGPTNQDAGSGVPTSPSYKLTIGFCAGTCGDKYCYGDFMS